MRRGDSSEFRTIVRWGSGMSARSGSKAGQRRRYLWAKRIAIWVRSERTLVQDEVNVEPTGAVASIVRRTAARRHRWALRRSGRCSLVATWMAASSSIVPMRWKAWVSPRDAPASRQRWLCSVSAWRVCSSTQNPLPGQADSDKAEQIDELRRDPGIATDLDRVDLPRPEVVGGPDRPAVTCRCPAARPASVCSAAWTCATALARGQA